ADELPRIVYHDHRPVIQIGDTLVVFFAFFEDKDAHGLARQHNGLERVGKLVDVQNLYALKLGNFVEVEIIGDDLGLIHFCQFNQFQVNFADGGKIILDNLDIDGSDLLHFLQDVEAPAATVALQGIGGVRNQL